METARRGGGIEGKLCLKKKGRVSGKIVKEKKKKSQRGFPQCGSKAPEGASPETVIIERGPSLRESGKIMGVSVGVRRSFVKSFSGGCSVWVVGRWGVSGCGPYLPKAQC